MHLRRISIHLQVVAVLFVIIGLIHCLATPVIMKGFSMFTGQHLSVFILMFIATGMAVFFIGMILLKIAVDLKKDRYVNQSIILYSVLFNLLLSAPAAYIMPDNPFAWLSGAVTIYLAVVYRQIRYSLKSIQTN